MSIFISLVSHDRREICHLRFHGNVKLTIGPNARHPSSGFLGPLTVCLNWFQVHWVGRLVSYELRPRIRVWARSWYCGYPGHIWPLDSTQTWSCSVSVRQLFHFCVNLGTFIFYGTGSAVAKWVGRSSSVCKYTFQPETPRWPTFLCILRIPCDICPVCWESQVCKLKLTRVPVMKLVYVITPCSSVTRYRFLFN